MAQYPPDPYTYPIQTIGNIHYVNSNTSVILINSRLTSNYTDEVVLLNSTIVPGRIVTVRDTAGALSTTKRIVVSTMLGVNFFDSNYPSTIIINQPYSFLTTLNQTTNSWITKYIWISN